MPHMAAVTRGVVASVPAAVEVAHDPAERAKVREWEFEEAREAEARRGLPNLAGEMGGRTLMDRCMAREGRPNCAPHHAHPAPLPRKPTLATAPPAPR